MTKTEIAQRLSMLERRGKWIDATFIVAFIALLIGVGVASYFYVLESRYGVAVNVVAAAVMALFAGWPVLFVLTPTVNWARRRLAPSWFIQGGATDDVVKVRGKVSAREWDGVKQRMLNIRPGLMPSTDAAERAGCLMAAVPASTGYDAARRTLGAVGIRC
jgi:hypothetical protein